MIVNAVAHIPLVPASMRPQSEVAIGPASHPDSTNRPEWVELLAEMEAEGVIVTGESRCTSEGSKCGVLEFIVGDKKALLQLVTVEVRVLF